MKFCFLFHSPHPTPPYPPPKYWTYLHRCFIFFVKNIIHAHMQQVLHSTKCCKLKQKNHKTKWKETYPAFTFQQIYNFYFICVLCHLTSPLIEKKQNKIEKNKRADIFYFIKHIYILLRKMQKSFDEGLKKTPNWCNCHINNNVNLVQFTLCVCLYHVCKYFTFFAMVNTHGQTFTMVYNMPPSPPPPEV